MTSTWKWGWGSLICRGRVSGVTQLVIFCGRYKCITHKWFKTIIFLEAVVSSSSSSQIHFDCRREQPPALPPSHSTDDQTKEPVIFSWHLMNIASSLAATKPFEQISVTDVVHIIFLPRTRHPFLLLSVTWTPLELGEFLLHDTCYTSTESWTYTNGKLRPSSSLF